MVANLGLCRFYFLNFRFLRFAIGLSAGVSSASHRQFVLADITTAVQHFVMHETRLRPYEPNPFCKATNFIVEAQVIAQSLA